MVHNKHADLYFYMPCVYCFHVLSLQHHALNLSHAICCVSLSLLLACFLTMVYGIQFVFEICGLCYGRYWVSGFPAGFHLLGGVEGLWGGGSSLEVGGSG